MKKGITKKMAVAAIFSLVLFLPIAFAQSIPQEAVADQEPEELPVSDFAQELSLTSEQKQQIKEQRYQAELKRIDTHNKVRIKELQLRHELERREVNSEAIDKIVKELKTLYATTLDQRIDSILKIKEILSPEQFEKFQSMVGRKTQKDLKGLKGRFQYWQKMKQNQHLPAQER